MGKQYHLAIWGVRKGVPPANFFFLLVPGVGPWYGASAIKPYCWVPSPGSVQDYNELKTFVMSCEWRYRYHWYMPFESFLTQLDCNRLQKKAVGTRSAAWRFENLYSITDSKMSTTSADKVCFTLRLSSLTSNQSFYSMFNNNQLKYWPWLILSSTREL